MQEFNYSNNNNNNNDLHFILKAPGEIIYEEDYFGETSIFLILEGTIEIYH